MRQQTDAVGNGRGIRKYALAAAVVGAAAAALASFTFAICPDCTSQRFINPADIEVPKEPEKTPEPKPEVSRTWRSTDS